MPLTYDWENSGPTTTKSNSIPDYKRVTDPQHGNRDRDGREKTRIGNDDLRFEARREELHKYQHNNRGAEGKGGMEPIDDGIPFLFCLLFP